MQTLWFVGERVERLSEVRELSSGEREQLRALRRRALRWVWIGASPIVVAAVSAAIAAALHRPVGRISVLEDVCVGTFLAAAILGIPAGGYLIVKHSLRARAHARDLRAAKVLVFPSANVLTASRTDARDGVSAALVGASIAPPRGAGGAIRTLEPDEVEQGLAVVRRKKPHVARTAILIAFLIGIVWQSLTRANAWPDRLRDAAATVFLLFWVVNRLREHRATRELRVLLSAPPVRVVPVSEGDHHAEVLEGSDLAWTLDGAPVPWRIDDKVDLLLFQVTGSESPPADARAGPRP